jgi:hypothetical protein
MAMAIAGAAEVEQETLNIMAGAVVGVVLFAEPAEFALIKPQSAFGYPHCFPGQ